MSAVMNEFMLMLLTRITIRRHFRKKKKWIDVANKNTDQELFDFKKSLKAYNYQTLRLLVS